MKALNTNMTGLNISYAISFLGERSCTSAEKYFKD